MKLRTALHGHQARTYERMGTEQCPIPAFLQAKSPQSPAATTFLLSEEASYITGHVLAIDGGISL